MPVHQHYKGTARRIKITSNYKKFSVKVKSPRRVKVKVKKV